MLSVVVVASANDCLTVCYCRQGDIHTRGRGQREAPKNGIRGRGIVVWDVRGLAWLRATEGLRGAGHCYAESRLAIMGAVLRMVRDGRRRSSCCQM